MEKSRGKVDTVRLQNLSYGHKQSAVLMAAVKLDLFTYISQGARTLDGIAAAVDLSPLNAERLVVACHALGLLERERDRYRNAPDVERFLVKGKINYVGPWLLFSGWDFEDWKNLPERLKSDSPPTVLGLNEGVTESMAREYHEATYSAGLGAGHRFAKDVDMSKRSLILDLGGGSGCYCIAAIQRYPHMKAMVFDFEPVCKVAREFIAQWGLEDRISTYPGDFTNDPLPRGADIMLMASNLPQYNEEVLTRVFRKGFEALEPGGEYHVVGETLNDEKNGPLGPALWGIHEALWGSQGKAHSERETSGYLEKAGFVDVQVYPFIPGSLTRITGRKP